MHLAAVFGKNRSQEFSGQNTLRMSLLMENPFAGVFGKNTLSISLLMLFVSTAWADFHRLCCWGGMPDGTVHVTAMRFGMICFHA